MRWGILAAVVLLAALALTWSLGATRPGPSTTTASTGPLRVYGPEATILLANVRLPEAGDGVNAWPNRRELLVKTFRKYDPDIIGTQEVSPAQGAYLIKELPDYAHYPDGSGEGKGALAPVAGMLSSLNTIFYRSDRFAFLGGSHGRIRPESVQANWTENAFYSLAVLADKSGKLPDLIVLDTHLRHDDQTAALDAQRLQQILAEQKAKHPKAQVVMLGDMNHNRMEKTIYPALLGQAGGVVLSDTYDYSRKKPGEHWGSWHAFTGQSSRDWPSDLILVSQGLGFTPAQVLRDSDHGRYPTDHFLVTTTIKAK